MYTYKMLVTIQHSLIFLAHPLKKVGPSLFFETFLLHPVPHLARRENASHAERLKFTTPLYEYRQISYVINLVLHMSSASALLSRPAVNHIPKLGRLTCDDRLNWAAHVLAV